MGGDYMRKSTTLIDIFNATFGGLKYIHKSTINDMPSFLRSCDYVKDSDFTDDELNWHINKFLEVLFGDK